MPRKWIVLAAALISVSGYPQGAQSEAEKAISKRIRTLRSLADDVRATTTLDLALEIRKLPAGLSKVGLAYGLSNHATEGDFGRDTLQAVADTLTLAVKETPSSDAGPYVHLANLARFEEIKVDLDSPAYKSALASVDALTEKQKKVDFSLTDRTGKTWTLSQLRGKVVLVNFWATWCPPCKKEMPDLDTLYKRFGAKNFVILAISDEKAETVDKYLTQHPVSYPVMLDPDRKVNTLYGVEGIPKNLIYNRKGQLVAQSIDMRTMGQFLKLLAKAGLK